MPKHKHKSSGISAWPKDERPRERLFREGEHRLSNTELLAILIRSGVKGESAISLARKILFKFKTFRNMSCADLASFREIKGLGAAKIAQIRSAVEIGRRLKEEEIREERPQIRSSKDIGELFLVRMRDLKKEVFKIIFLNSQNRIIDILEVVEGTVDQAYPIIREIFQKAIQNFALSIICVHNHPSGDPTPSKEDEIFTQELVQGGRVLQIKVLDHIIIGNNIYYSFADEGII
ncbi:MAG: DNA repair protein RadC [Candidatus Omnitrophota bacterium]